MVRVAAEPVVFWFNVGKSPDVAIDGTPVPVVFRNIPVPSPDSATPLILVTVAEFDPCATLISPVKAALVSNGVPSTYTSVESTIAPTASCAPSAKST